MQAKTIENTTSNDLETFLQFGNSAGRQGNLEESLEWYKKGLTRAKELQDKIKISHFSSLIMTLL